MRNTRSGRIRSQQTGGTQIDGIDDLSAGSRSVSVDFTVARAPSADDVEYEYEVNLVPADDTNVINSETDTGTINAGDGFDSQSVVLYHGGVTGPHFVTVNLLSPSTDSVSAEIDIGGSFSGSLVYVSSCSAGGTWTAGERETVPVSIRNENADPATFDLELVIGNQVFDGGERQIDGGSSADFDVDLTVPDVGDETEAAVTARAANVEDDA